jgi:hypothetical protein
MRDGFGPRLFFHAKDLLIPAIAQRPFDGTKRRRVTRRRCKTFLANLDAITVEQMCDTAEKTHVLDDEKVSSDFAI